MSESVAPDDVVREVLREVLGELLPDMVAGALEQRSGAPSVHETQRGHSPLERNGAGAGADSAPAHRAGSPVPVVPAPPVAAVHRPSTWVAPEAPAASGPGAPAEPIRREEGRAIVEMVTIETDADLDEFARRLLRLYENPRNRQAVRTRRLRFSLGRTAAGGAAVPAVRIEKGAVTERVVNEAAAAASKLVLGPGAVLTPMARDRAKKLHVEIEREKRC